MAAKRASTDTAQEEDHFDKAAKIEGAGIRDGPGKTFSGPSDLTGSSFVVTGEFDMGRPAAEALIVKLGGRVVSNVAKSTSYLLLGKPGVGQFNTKTGPGTAKHKQAKKFKISIVDEAWLVAQSGEEAVSIPELFERVHAATKSLGHTIELPPPVTDDEIAAVEAKLGYKLNAQLKEVYKISNGGLLGWTKLENQGQQDYPPLHRFYKAMRMVAVDEYVHVSGSGVVFEWDTSFDSQCGNTIIAGSIAELLTQWAERLEAEAERLEAEAASSGEKKPLGRWQTWRSDAEIDIDKSEAHKGFFASFKSAYERNLGKWPQFVD